jgi:predicted unusual protein kinase regulating ubiquinone biosynthesis (AarF/ABC1/UbiB family)
MSKDIGLFVKNIGCVINTIYIASCETLIYCLTGDFKRFMINLTDKLYGVNILYVKLFQSLAHNNKLISEDNNQIFLEYTDNVPYTINDIDLDMLNDYKTEYNIECDIMNPMNSGMISLIYSARDMNNNRDVILKVKRLHIGKKLDDAIDNVVFLLYFLSWIPLLQNFEIPSIINKNIQVLKQQTDFNEEKRNIIFMKEKCKCLDYIEIPEVFTDLNNDSCYSNMIAMEYIHGVSIDDIPEEYYMEYAKLNIRFGLASFVNANKLHGDLHSGNIIFILNDEKNDPGPKYKLGLIDWGILLDIDPFVCDAIFDFITEIFTVSSKTSAKKIITNVLLEPKEVVDSLDVCHYDRLVSICAKIIDETLINDKEASQLQIFEAIHTINDYFISNDMFSLGIHPSHGFVKIQLAFAMTNSITLRLCKNKYKECVRDVLDGLIPKDVFEW